MCNPLCDNSTDAALRCECLEQYNCVGGRCQCDIKIDCPFDEAECEKECGCEEKCKCENGLCTCNDDIDQCPFDGSRCVQICGCSRNCECTDITNTTCVCKDPCVCAEPPRVCPFKPDECVARCGCMERCADFCFGDLCQCNPEKPCP